MRTHTSGRRTQRELKSGRQPGFTLMELMVTLAVAAVIMGLAVPNFGAHLRNSRLTGAANDLLAATHLARSEAIKRQLPVAICASTTQNSNPPTCSGGPFTGWVVWVDADNDWVPDNNVNEPVLRRHATLDASITVRTDNSGIVKYTTSGFAAPAGGGFVPTANIAMCDYRGTAITVGGVSAGRAIRITATGRARVTRDQAEVNATLTALGQSCPP